MQQYGQGSGRLGRMLASHQTLGIGSSMKFSLGHAVRFCRVATAAAAITTVGSVATVVTLGLVSTQAQAATVSRISVQGNQRVDDETVRSYLTITPGRSFSSFDTDESLRQLFATGLFRDVQIFQEGRTLVVSVEEYPIVSRVIFEGNDKVKTELLESVVQLGDRAVLSEEVLASDRERVREVLRRNGRGASEVTTEVVELGSNRVNVIFRIDEGGRTRIGRIDFVGNSAFGDRRLEEVISLNETNFLSWLKRDDVFDPDKLRTDEERLRRFYFNQGYADFEVLSAEADLDPETNRYTITFTVDEGELYRFGSVEIDNTLAAIDTDRLRREVSVREGQKYSAEDIETSLADLTDAIARQGFAFAQVTPRGEKDPDGRTVGVTFFVDEGPRVYVDQIIIRGNTRTRDYVIRREFDLSEGDAYNRVLVNQAKRRLEALGFFESVTIAPQQGSAPDRIDLIVQVQDKATGELSIGGGYSTQSGALAELSFTERNFLGRGQYLKISGGYGQDVNRYELSFTEPYFLGRRIAAGFDAGYTINEVNDRQPYELETTFIRPRLSAKITENLTASVNYTYKSENASDARATLPVAGGTFIVDPAVQALIDQGSYVTSSAGYSFVYSSLDSFQNPREGIYGRFDQQFAGLGGDAEYLQTTARVAAYYTVNTANDIVVLGQLGGGHITAFNDGLRLSDQFFRGGDIVRGFEASGIGPRNLGTSLGGTTYFNATAEVQFPLPGIPRSYGLRGALFADAATLYGYDLTTPAAVTALGINDKAIRASIGASLMWDSPFGPLRADVAYPIAKEEYDKEQVFRFGVSTRF